MNTLWIILNVIVWDMIWKVIAMWKAGRNNQLGWFISLAVINSLGIIPILYILNFQKKNLSNSDNQKGGKKL